MDHFPRPVRFSREHFTKIMTFQPFLEIVSLADIISVNDRAFENVNEVFHK